MSTTQTGIKNTMDIASMIERKLNACMPFEEEIGNLNASEFENAYELRYNSSSYLLDMNDYNIYTQTY